MLRLPERKVLITFNARNEHDQKLFCDDLSEAIAESNEVELIRSKSELQHNSNKLNTTTTKLATINEVIKSTPSSNNNDNKINDLLMKDEIISSSIERIPSNSLLDLSQTINDTYSKHLSFMNGLIDLCFNFYFFFLSYLVKNQTEIESAENELDCSLPASKTFRVSIFSHSIAYFYLKKQFGNKS